MHAAATNHRLHLQTQNTLYSLYVTKTLYLPLATNYRRTSSPHTERNVHRTQLTHNHTLTNYISPTDYNRSADAGGDDGSSRCCIGVSGSASTDIERRAASSDGTAVGIRRNGLTTTAGLSVAS